MCHIIKTNNKLVIIYNTSNKYNYNTGNKYNMMTTLFIIFLI